MVGRGRAALLRNVCCSAQVSLHVSHQPAGLLAFLRQSHAYDLDKALVMCSEHKPEPLVREIVFLQKRQGNFRWGRSAVA